MFQRKTQSEKYWGTGFRFSGADLTYLGEWVMDKGSPCTMDELVLALIEFRIRQEDAQLREELSKGVLYQPQEDFTVGQRVVFPAFDFAAATVVEVRPGANPEHGDFKVIRVQLDGKRRTREFAAALQTSHQLNLADGGDALLGQADAPVPAVIKDTLAVDLDRRLTAHLQGDLANVFVQRNGHWLLQDMLADINVGHLNIAEALIEIASQPVTTAHLLNEFDLPSEASPEIRSFSLEYALQEDERFDDVGAVGQAQWYLRRLEPEAAVQVPELLRYAPDAYDRASLSADLLRLEVELGDEWSDGASELEFAAPRVTVVLTYPHRRSGTLPLSSRIAQLFPSTSADRTMVTLVDGRWRQRFRGWVVRRSRYIVGLDKWFEEHKIPVGAYVTLEPGPEAGEVVVDIQPRRMRREWARMGRVDGDQLVFEMRKTPIACEYDELMVVDALGSEDVARLRRTPDLRATPLEELLDGVFLELLKLSPEGKVHAKTVYSALNLLRRIPPGPVFVALLNARRYQPVGDGFWSLI